MYNYKMIGLGKMGYNLFLNMIEQGLSVKGYDHSEQQRRRCDYQEHIIDNFEDLFDEKLNVYWMMLPAGEVTQTMFEKILTKAKPGDIIIDAGNAHYESSIQKYNLAFDKDIDFIDIGVSGGQEGARHNGCMMLGGDNRVFSKIESDLSKLCTEGGLLFAGKPGSGHYLKMVHNGIEYGMMQSIAEGFNILKHSDHYDFVHSDVARLFNSGSVVRSWLMELTQNAFTNNEDLDNIQGIVASSGEGKWTVEEALRLQVNIPVISQSLFVRYASQDTMRFGEKVTASLRNQFGGHAVVEE